MVDRTAVITKDAWLLQGIGGTAKYGNGTGSLVHVGRVPSGSSDPDWKSRGIFEVPLRTEANDGILDGLSSISAATIEFTVGGNACLVGGRGLYFYAFLEEVTSDFIEKVPPFDPDCSFGSGTGAGVWGTDTAIVTNRAFASYSGLSGGDKVSWDVAAMIAAKLADPSATVLRFRVIFANSAGTVYDESAGAPRATGFHTREDTTSSERPVLKVTGSTGAVTKTDTDAILIADTGDKTITGTTTPAGTDSITITDALIYAGPAASWSTTFNADGNGYGQVYLPRGATSLADVLSGIGETAALLLDISESDVIVTARFWIDKVPVTAAANFNLIARAADKDHWYCCSAEASGHGMSVSLQYKGGTPPSIHGLAFLLDLRPIQIGTVYWLKFLVQGSSPTVLAGKLWRDGESEPGAYQITVNDSTDGLQVAGAVGLGANMYDVSNKPITFTFDDFSVVAP